MLSNFIMLSRNQSGVYPFAVDLGSCQNIYQSASPFFGISMQRLCVDLDPLNSAPTAHTSRLFPQWRHYGKKENNTVKNSNHARGLGIVNLPWEN